MRFVIYGAGGVGGTIGARLHLQGFSVVLIARGEHGRVLQNHGMRFIAPEGSHSLDIPTMLHPGEIEFKPDDIVLLTMKSQHTTNALEDLVSANPGDVAVVCGQNAVANERMALRRFRRVYGMLINLPAQHLSPGEVLSFGAGTSGILDAGRFPDGLDDTVVELCAALSASGFIAEPDARIMRKKYAKLIFNLANGLEAATNRADVQDIGRVLKTEAQACYAAAGIDCADAREIDTRSRKAYEFVQLPGHPRFGGSTWQSVDRGTRNIETDYLNGEIVQLGRTYGVPTPANEVCQQLGQRMVRDALPVGHFSVAEIESMIARRSLEAAPNEERIL
jgi:2-dehydropantoate 2-reductase